jgi:hypothetical protein
MISSVIYAIGRFGITSSAGFYQPNGNFLQVFPSRRIFRDKSSWAAAWYIFGDEMITMHLRRLPQPFSKPVN